MTVDDALMAWLDDTARRCSANTIAGYAMVARRWLGCLEYGGQEKVAGIKPHDLRSFVYRLQEDGVQPSSIKQYLISLSAFFSFCVEEEWVAVNPLSGGKVKRPRVPQRIVAYYTTEEIGRLLAMCETEVRFKELRDKAIILLLLDSGMRAFELCGLRTESVDMEARSCKVFGKGSRERLVRFSRATARALTTYLWLAKLRPGEPFFFSVRRRPFTPDTLYQHIKALAKKAGLSHWGVHQLRHTYAVHFLRNGGSLPDCQRQLGHRDPALTMRYAMLADGDADGARMQQRYSPVEALGRR